jgi:hypothetical protein
MRVDAPNWRVDAPNWRISACDCFRAVERSELNRTLFGAALVCAKSGDDFRQHFDNVGVMIANAEARCVITHDEAWRGRRSWVAMEAELRLRTLPPQQRRALLLNPMPGPQVFIPLHRRLEMLRDLDEAA